ncbi:MAG: HU family DNA-binding protein [Methyloglobulus sp.]|nr:HU family DNA-binding protein [Methyloglobulus sp.]
MTKSELIAAIAAHANLTQADAGRALAALTQTIEATLAAGNSITLVGFGTFAVKDRAERIGRNPQTGLEITIAAAKTPSFKSGKALKAAVHGQTY